MKEFASISINNLDERYAVPSYSTPWNSRKDWQTNYPQSVGIEELQLLGWQPVSQSISPGYEGNRYPVYHFLFQRERQDA